MHALKSIQSRIHAQSSSLYGGIDVTDTVVIGNCFLSVIGYEIGCVTEARMNVAECMEDKIRSGIQHLRCVGPAQSVT